MKYEIAAFKNDEFDRYSRFLESFTSRKYKPGNLVGTKWWLLARDYPGFVFFAHNGFEIAARCMITKRVLCYRNEDLFCFESGGTWTLPEHQRKGLFTRLAQEAVRVGFEAGAKIIYSTPNARSGPGRHKLGFEFTSRANTYLIVAPSLINMFSRRIGWKNKVSEKREACVPERETKVRELSIKEYARVASQYPRMNDVQDD